MTVDQAFKNLKSLLDSPDLRLSWVEHNGLRQSLQLLHQEALDNQEEKSEKPEKRKAK